MNIEDNQDELLERARGILEELLSLMGIEASITTSAEFPVDGETEMLSYSSLNVEGEDLGILIGRRGQTLSALQYMVRFIICHQIQTRLPIIIDVEGYKRRRYASLRDLAQLIAEQVVLKERPFTLEPMSAFERRIIHLTLANHPGVTTESTGVGDARKVVVMAKNS